MKIEHIRPRLKLELEQWFIKQCRDPFKDYYLYYMESTPEHDGGFSICSEQPANKDCKLASDKPIDKSTTKEANFVTLFQVIQRLPILEF